MSTVLGRPPAEAGKQLVPCLGLHGHNGPVARPWVGGGKVDGKTGKLAGPVEGGREGNGVEGMEGGDGGRGEGGVGGCLMCSHLSVKVEWAMEKGGLGLITVN